MLLLDDLGTLDRRCEAPLHYARTDAFPWRRRASVPPIARAAVVSPPSVDGAPPDLTDLEARARYQRDRLALYRARMHGANAASVERLEELERAAAAADERLRTARRLGHR